MASRIVIYQRDNGIKLYVNITKDNLVENITGADIKATFEGGTTGTRIIKSTSSLDPRDLIEITDATMGEICINLYEKDTEVVDVYNIRITTKYSNQTQLTTDEIMLDGSKVTLQIKQPKVEFLSSNNP